MRPARILAAPKLRRNTACTRSQASLTAKACPTKYEMRKKSGSFVLVGYVVEFFSRVGWKRTGSLRWWEKGAERVGRAPSFSLNDVKRPAKLRCRSRARVMVRKSKATPFHNPYALSPPRGSQRRYRYGKTPRATRFPERARASAKTSLEVA